MSFINRRKFLGLLVLLGCKEEDMNIAKLEWWKGGISSLPPAEIGTLFDDDFARLSIGSEYSVRGGFDNLNPQPTYTLDGSKMQFTGAWTSFRSTNRLSRIDSPNSFSDWTLGLDFELQSSYVNASTRGVLIGMDTCQDTGLNSGSWSVFASVRDATPGNIHRIYSQNGATNRNDTSYIQRGSNITQALTLNYRYRIILKRYWGTTGHVYLFELWDIETTPTLLGSTSFENSLASYPTTSSAHRTSYPTIGSMGGTIDIYRFWMNTQCNSNIDYLFVGDSIVSGLYADDVASRWAQQVADDGAKTYEVSSGPGDLISDFNLKINAANNIAKLKYYNPKTVFIHIGTNDIANDWAGFTTWRTVYQDAVDALKADISGVRIIHLYAIPRGTLGDKTRINTWNSWIASTFTGDTVIDINTPLNDGANNIAVAYDSGDQTHPNQAGNDLIASTILAAL